MSGLAIPGANAGIHYSCSRLRTSTTCLGCSFRGPRSHCPTKDEMADYLEAYASKFDLPVRLDTRVDAVTKNADHFMIIANDHRIEADNVVLATGGYQAAHL